MARTLIWEAYRSQHGGQRCVISSQSCNRTEKFLLSDLLGNKGKPKTANWKSGKWKEHSNSGE